MGAGGIAEEVEESGIGGVDVSDQDFVAGAGVDIVAAGTAGDPIASREGLDAIVAVRG